MIQNHILDKWVANMLVHYKSRNKKQSKFLDDENLIYEKHKPGFYVDSMQNAMQLR